jgi:hypothetical protein
MADVTTRVPAALGSATVNRKYWLDVRERASDPWVPFYGVQELKTKGAEATTQDSSDFDGEGYKDQDVTALAWGAEGKCVRKRKGDDSTAYDPGQEIVRLAAERIGHRIQVRFYEMDDDGPRVEATEGWATVTWNEDGGGMDALATASFTIAGKGRPTSKEHPDAQPAVPRIASVLPSGAAATQQVVIEGSGFTGLTGAGAVKFGGTNASAYSVLSDQTILATVPAGAAGDTTVAVGPATVPYTRG